MKKCKICKESFTPIRSTLEPVCDNYNCEDFDIFDYETRFSVGKNNILNCLKD